MFFIVPLLAILRTSPSEILCPIPSFILLPLKISSGDIQSFQLYMLSNKDPIQYNVPLPDQDKKGGNSICFAVSNTSKVSIPSFLKIIANSLISAIFISLWVFSMTFAASAIFILLALYVLLIISEYKSSIQFYVHTLPLVT